MFVRISGVVMFVGLFAIAGTTAVWSDENRPQEDVARMLFDFESDEAAQRWYTVNDGVMGGISEGRVRVTEEATLEFFGELSLENRGGFASVRAQPAELKLQQDDMVVVRIRGDGRTYYFSAYVPTVRIAFSYRKPIETVDGEWREVRVRLSELVPTSFGRPIKRLGPVDPTRINALGFLLADKKAGPFKLEVDWIGVVNRRQE